MHSGGKGTLFPRVPIGNDLCRYPIFLKIFHRTDISQDQHQGFGLSQDISHGPDRNRYFTRSTLEVSGISQDKTDISQNQHQGIRYLTMFTIHHEGDRYRCAGIKYFTR